MPTRRLHMKSPLQVLFGCVPNYIKLQIFGCLCFPWLTPYTPNKLVPKSKPCVFLGYIPTQSAYYCLDPQSSKIFTSRHVQFVEDIFPYSSPLTSSAPPDSTSNLNLLQTPQQPAPLIPSQPLAITHPIQQPPSSPNILSSSFNQAPVLDPSPSSNLAPSSSPISPYVPSPHPSSTPATSINEYTPVEPTCFSQAIKHPEWKAAMSEEFNALIANCTWTLVPHQSHHIIGNKWVYRLKRNIDGSIARYKARLVAKRYHQRPGVDYNDTFSPVIKPQTIKVVLCLAISKGWSLSHMDINNAFLHGTIAEDIYMSQPSEFVHPQYPNHVCKLQKALYGLK
uniref:Retrovirus-related Pol polyprotein from transposon TNT 1-94 n=1 Tax=Cajanus cajan TaxID=3821 RepID=A0A151TVL5_CAJCA|nr:Retrovirus-related Pol polyprotein from transposon TNT 1-94 [Cajanus cajan]